MRKVRMSEFLKKERVAVLCLAKLQQSWLVILIVVVVVVSPPPVLTWSVDLCPNVRHALQRSS